MVGKTNRRPCLHEADFQIEGPSAGEVNVRRLLDIAVRCGLNPEQQKASVLLTEDLDEVHRLVQRGGELHIAFRPSKVHRRQPEAPFGHPPLPPAGVPERTVAYSGYSEPGLPSLYS